MGSIAQHLFLENSSELGQYAVADETGDVAVLLRSDGKSVNARLRTILPCAVSAAAYFWVGRVVVELGGVGLVEERHEAALLACMQQQQQQQM